MESTVQPIDTSSLLGQNPQDIIQNLIKENSLLKRRNQELELLNNMAKAVTEDFDIKRIMQIVIDAGTQLAGATTGAFFYTNDNSVGTYTLYTLSGEHVHPSSFLLPEENVNGEIITHNVVKSDDITNDKKFNKLISLATTNFKSYMMAPVISKTGELIGRLFFTHKNAFAFTEKEEHLISIVAGQAAIAVEISRLFESKQANLEYFRSMAESIPQMVWTGKEDGTVDYLNQQWLDYTKLPLEELKGMGWIKTIHPEDYEKTIKQWTSATAAGSLFEQEYRLKRGTDNTYRWYLGRALPIKNKSGEIVKWFGTCTDIHDQRNLQEKKDQFFGIASHELKTPITSIKAYVQLLERLLADNETATNYLSKTNTYIDKLNTLIADLLDVSKIQAGKLPFYISEFDFDHLVNEIVENVQPTAQKHRIIVEGSAGQMVRGDRQRLEQVFVNYLSNAIKYSPQSDKVVIKVSKTNKEVKVAIEDYGIGIPEENQQKIFDRFYRVETDCQKFSGLGIGLYISSEIIRRHKGKTWVNSLEGKGSTFYFSLPIKKDLKATL